VQSVLDAQDTLDKVPALGVVWTCQDVPSHRSASVDEPT
jgi:hypothetical protein